MSAEQFAATVFVVYLLNCTAGFIVNVKDTIDAPSQPRNGSVDIRSLMQMLVAQLIHMNESFHRLETEYTSQIVNLTNQLHKLERQSQTGTGIGFSLYAPLNGTGGDSSSTLKFRYIVENSEDAFNMTAGEFVCRKSGLYFFSSTAVRLKSIANRDAYCYFYKNRIKHSFVAGYAADAEATNPSGTNSILYHLRPGDTVSLRACVNSIYFDSSTSFTGFLVHADN